MHTEHAVDEPLTHVVQCAALQGVDGVPVWLGDGGPVVLDDGVPVVVADGVGQFPVYSMNVSVLAQMYARGSGLGSGPHTLLPSHHPHN